MTLCSRGFEIGQFVDGHRVLKNQPSRHFTKARACLVNVAATSCTLRSALFDLPWYCPPEVLASAFFFLSASAAGSFERIFLATSDIISSVLIAAHSESKKQSRKEFKMRNRRQSILLFSRRLTRISTTRDQYNCCA